MHAVISDDFRHQPGLPLSGGADTVMVVEKGSEATPVVNVARCAAELFTHISRAAAAVALSMQRRTNPWACLPSVNLLDEALYSHRGGDYVIRLLSFPADAKLDVALVGSSAQVRQAVDAIAI